MFYLIIIFIIYILAFPKEVLAYLDPGTGSYITQIILGLLFGGVVSVKLYWKKIRNFFSRDNSGQKKKDER